MRRARGAVCIAALLMLGVIASPGCRRRAVVPAPVVVETGRFPHEMHGALACTACHDLDAVLTGRTSRPGTRDHAPCDDEQCHREAFLGAPGPLCEICHREVQPGQPGASPLVAYPPTRGRRALASAFSHARHLDFARMEEHVGFHVWCGDCHQAVQPEGAGDPRAGIMLLPGHDVCGRCHAPEAAPPSAPRMQQCRACHRERPAQPARQRRLIAGDLRFGHDRHAFDRRGEAIACVTCHAESPAVDAPERHPTPTTAACVACHDDKERTPARLRMQVCSACHQVPRVLLDALPPRSHLPARERPEDHTLAFRRDHAAEAAAAPDRCAMCHTFMSGTTRDACDECHQVMRPADHVLTWRELDHGPEAAARSERCSTCHATPFCVSCHSITPRSHLPLSEWTTRHGVPASLNPSSCLTCHDAGRSCVRCHGGLGAARRGGS
jgi:hypothetical protein